MSDLLEHDEGFCRQATGCECMCAECVDCDTADDLPVEQ